MNGKLSDQPVVVAQSAKQAVGVVGGAVSITLHLSRPPESFNAAYWLVNCAQTNCSAATVVAAAAVEAVGATSMKTDDEAGRGRSLPRRAAAACSRRWSTSLRCTAILHCSARQVRGGSTTAVWSFMRVFSLALYST